MKNPLIIVAIAASLLSAPAYAGAGSPPTKEERAQRMERMKAHLELSDEQAAQIQQIRADGGSRDDIRAVLNEEQKAKMDEARKLHGGKGGKRHDSPPAGAE